MADEIVDDGKDNIVEIDQADMFEAPAEREESAETPAETVAEVETPTEAVEPETPAPETPTAPTHPIELIAQATQLGIGADEIAGMTTAELRHEIRFETRMAQFANIRKTPIEEAAALPDTRNPVYAKKQADDEDPLAGIDREAILPELLGPLEKLAAQNKALRDKFEASEKARQTAAQSQSFEQVRTRVASVIDSIAPGTSAKFNPATKEGLVLHNALFGQLATLEQLALSRGQTPTEADLVRKALGTFDMLPAKEAKDAAKIAAFEAEKARFDEGALGTPQARQNPAKLLDVLKEKSRKVGRTAEEVEPFDDVDSSLEPLPG